MRFVAALFALSTLGALANAAEVPAAGAPLAPPAGDPAPVPPVVLAPPPPVLAPSNWTNKGKVGIALMNVTTGGADESRDPTIAGSSRSTTYLLSFEGNLRWKAEPYSVEQNLKVKYGQTKTNDSPLSESADELRYDGVLRKTIVKPHYVYLGWVGESTFTSPDPENYRLNPIIAKASGGYGQLYEDFLQEKSRLDARIGVRAQKRWGSLVPESQRSIETGPEAFLRYEHTVFKQDDRSLLYWAQYEGFSEFNNLGHITNLITAGLTAQLARYLTVDLGLRMYYETTPKEFEDGTPPGYNSWSVRQDTLLGLTYIW